MSETTTQGSSVSAFVSTLVVNVVIFSIFVSLFIVLKPKQSRIYQPRHVVDTVPGELQVEEQPSGVFGWFSFLWKQPTSFYVEKCGPDGYFFLRYLRVFIIVFTLTGLLIWPILFPINATGGGGQEGLDILSYSNNTYKWRVFAHVFLSWVLFGFCIYTIYKELVYYVSFRHALQVSPRYDSLLSSRTLLLDNVPESLSSEGELRTVFPAANHVWYARDHKELEDVVKERTKLAGTYESTLVKSIKKAVKDRKKLAKKGAALPEPADQFETYYKEGKLPTHRLKFLIGKKVSTLDYAPKRLSELNGELATAQNNWQDAKMVGSVFIEFPTQLELQRAYQAVPYNKDLKLSRRVTGVAPDDIIWENLQVGFVTRNSRAILAKTVLSLTLIFWAIPVAVVGAISNINYLTTKLPWLDFINNMPDVLMGIITGLLPTVALAVLMSLLPPFIKKMGKISGILTFQGVEMWCQSWYFAFQVIQVFLVTTLASSASSVVESIIDDPSSAMTLLGENLPKSSNFYIAYALLQGLTISSGVLAQVVGLILYHVLGKALDGTPRKKWNRYNTLGQPGWGTIYPIFQLLLVIVLCYAIVSPLIIIFIVIGLTLIYIAYMYNLTFVMEHSADARGRYYPKALFQTFVGIYLGEFVLIALFVMPENWACVVLEAVMVAVTVAAHLYMRWKFEPLFDAVPLSAIHIAQGDSGFQYPMKDQGLSEISQTGKEFFTETPATGPVETEKISKSNKDIKQDIESPARTGTGSGSLSSILSPEKNESIQPDTQSHVGFLNRDDEDQSGKVNAKTLQRFFKPRVYSSFEALRKIIPVRWNKRVRYDPQTVEFGYTSPLVRDAPPQIWIPRDSFGLSRTAVSTAREHGVTVSDQNAEIQDDGTLLYTGLPPDYEEAVKE
ncbi:hypothetical protein LJB42_000721 [Komagataella kurtzmanii]|nr:hypothetical protein LJB42_000721 [Komagataella kurtzmanii]